jgi:beta-xylosidase
MKAGDRAGFAAFNDETRAWIIKKQGSRTMLELADLSVKLSQRNKEVTEVNEKTIEQIDLSGKNIDRTKIWLRIDGDFRPGQRDMATFYYSLDGQEWHKTAEAYHMRFDWQRFFMGSKFGIFCYATKKKGGFIDVDSFDYKVVDKR